MHDSGEVRRDRRLAGGRGLEISYDAADLTVDVRAQVGDDHVGARLAQGVDHGRADEACAAGHQDPLAGDRRHMTSEIGMPAQSVTGGVTRRAAGSHGRAGAAVYSMTTTGDTKETDDAGPGPRRRRLLRMAYRAAPVRRRT